MKQPRKKPWKCLDIAKKIVNALSKKHWSSTKSLLSTVSSNEEMSESKNLVHPKTAEEINAYSGSFKLYDVIKGIMGRDLETINVPNTKYFENYSKVVNQDNFF